MGPGPRARHEEGEPEAVPLLVEPGVDALRIGVHDGPSLGRHGRHVALGRLPPAERADEAVGVELALAEHSGRRPAQRGCWTSICHIRSWAWTKPWAMNRSCAVSARMWAMPATSRTTVTGRSSPGTVSAPLVCGSARPVTQARAPMPAPTATRTTTSTTASTRLSRTLPPAAIPEPPRSYAVEGPVRAAVRRRNPARSPCARSHPRRRRRRARRRDVSRRRARSAGRCIPRRIASPSVAFGSG